MPDVLHFEVDQVLDQMLQVFWQHGYKSTTTRQLAASANLSESSLFNTFGSKQAIYKRVLQRYIDYNSHLLKLLEENESPLQGLRQYWETIAGYAADKNRTKGCMITNAAVAESDNPEIAEFIKTAHLRSEKAFKKTLDRAIEAGELKPDTDTAAIAQFLLHSTQGIRVLSRLTPSRKKMNNIVDGVMSVVEQHRLDR